MKMHEAKQVGSEAIRKSRRNGDAVDKIKAEAEVIEGEVQKTIRRFAQRLKRYRDRLTQRIEAPPAKLEVCDGKEGGE